MELSTKISMKKQDNSFVVTPLENDHILFDKILNTKSEYFLISVATPIVKKTYSQVKTVWKLVEMIFISQEGRKPTEHERRCLYEDLLEEYGMKRVSSITGKLVPIHVSQADIKACAFFIEGLIIHLASYCELSLQSQTEVKQIIQQWQSINDARSVDDVENCSMEEYRERHIVSEASCLGGELHLHHIITKGSDERLRDCTANWIMLTVKEHQQLHQYGEQWFLGKYPHLKEKFARIKAYQSELNRKGEINKNE